MDLRHLSYFVAVVEEGGFNAAAKRLYIAQPTLSYQIKELESELNILLLVRESSRRAVPTEAGLILYRRAKKLLSIAQSIEAELRSFMFSPSGSLKLATNASSPIIHPAIINFFHSHPSITLDLRDGSNERILELLTSGISEIGIVNGKVTSSGIEHIPLMHLSAVAIGTDDFLSEDVAEVSMKDMKDIPLLVQREDIPAIEKACAQYDFSPRIVCVSDDSKTRLLYAEYGLGVAIVPKSKAHTSLAYGLRILAIKDLEMNVQIEMIFRNDQPLSQTAQAFVNLVKEIAPFEDT